MNRENQLLNNQTGFIQLKDSNIRQTLKVFLTSLKSSRLTTNQVNKEYPLADPNSNIYRDMTANGIATMLNNYNDVFLGAQRP